EWTRFHHCLPERSFLEHAVDVDLDRGLTEIMDGRIEGDLRAGDERVLLAVVGDHGHHAVERGRPAGLDDLHRRRHRLDGAPRPLGWDAGALQPLAENEAKLVLEAGAPHPREPPGPSALPAPVLEQAREHRLGNAELLADGLRGEPYFPPSLHLAARRMAREQRQVDA